MADHTAPIRPRRSVLFMPGANARALQKGRELPCDGIIFDLEDAVAPDAKRTARDQVAAALAEGGYGPRERIVRVNGLETPWGYDDLVAAANMECDAILLPKVESADMVRRIEIVLETAGVPDGTAIWCMIETPRGVLTVQDICQATPRLAALVMGTNDLGKELHAQQTLDRQPFMTSFGLCMLAARAYGLDILDGVFPDLENPEGLAASCRQSMELGFDGKTLIHPSQIAPANDAFAPDAEAVLWSRRVIEAYAEAQQEGRGVIQLDGRLIEELHVEEAKRLVALADTIEARKGG